MSRATEELRLYVDNDGKIHKRLTSPLQKRIAKELADGTYNRERALRSFLSIATEGARAYGREGFEDKIVFSAADKRAVATGMLDHFLTEHRLNGLGSPGGVKTKAQIEREIAAALKK
jgi:hypothetical protein